MYLYMQISMVVDAGSSEAGGTSTGVENMSTSEHPLQVCGVAMVTVVVQIETCLAKYLTQVVATHDLGYL